MELPVTPVFSVTPDGGAGEICRLNDSTGEPGVVGVFHATLSDLSPKSSVGGTGVSGRASGRATADAPDGSESPTRLVATTSKVYSTLFVSPSSVHVVESHRLLYALPDVLLTV